MLVISQSDDLFVTINPLVEDIAFVSNNQLFLESVKVKMRSTPHVKMFVELKSFIRCKNTRYPPEIKVTKDTYAKIVLEKFQILNWNPDLTKIALHTDMVARNEYKNGL